MMTMTPAERVAERTWSTLRLAKQLRARFGEETLTDLLVLDMLPHQRTKGFWLRPTRKLDEGWCGADLLVAVRHQTGRWSRFALQAKKLYPDDRYRMLSRVTESLDQLEKLEEFARQFHALPLYLLYNHSNTAERSEHWNCCKQSFDECQLGCTLVPSWHIRRMLCRPPPPRDFDSAHRVKQARPWRCAFDCQSAEKELRQMALPTSRDPGTPAADAPDNWSFEPMAAAWPERLFQIPGTQLTTEDVDQVRSDLGDFYRSVAEDASRESIGSDEPLYPARLLIVDRS